jgi:hypothetical protein
VKSRLFHNVVRVQVSFLLWCVCRLLVSLFVCLLLFLLENVVGDALAVWQKWSDHQALMRVGCTNVLDHFCVLCIVLCSWLEISLLDVLFVVIKFAHVRACHCVLFFYELRQPVVKEVLQMFSLDDFVLIVLVFWVLLFLKFLGLM